METLLIEGSAKTPTIKFDAEQGIIEIKGRSIPENSIEFYKPLIDWLEKYS
ncbi:MAG: SiaC family regulatory phosphoprotein, partial [Bacteroidota bacterium]